MNTQPRLVAALWLLAAMLAAPAAHAVGGLHRCQTGDGESVYTDTACAVLGARPAPMPPELLSRLASDAYASGNPELFRSNQWISNVPKRRPAAGGCARNVGQLSLDLLGAFAMGDVNRIAESFHWPGLAHQQAHAVMQRLQWLARKPLVDAIYWPGLASNGGAGGAMQLTFGAPEQVLELGVERYSGCYFVRF